MILGGSIAFLVGCDSMIVAPIAPEILESWGASASLSALLVAAYALAYALTSPFFGALADYRGRRSVGTAGLIAFAAGTALTFVSSNLATGLTVRALAGLGAGMAIPVVFGEIISRSTPQTRGPNVGIVTGMLLSATVVGVPLGSLLASAVGWQWTFLLISIPGFLVVFPAIRIFDATGGQDVGSRASAAVAGMLKTALTHRRLLLVLLSAGLWHAGFAVTYTSIGAFYENRYGFGSAQMSGVMLAAGGAGALSSFVGGRRRFLRDRRLRHRRSRRCAHRVLAWTGGRDGARPDDVEHRRPRGTACVRDSRGHPQPPTPGDRTRPQWSDAVFRAVRRLIRGRGDPHRHA